jgi:hypothetical protein
MKLDHKIVFSGKYYWIRLGKVGIVIALILSILAQIEWYTATFLEWFIFDETCKAFDIVCTYSTRGFFSPSPPNFIGSAILIIIFFIVGVFWGSIADMSIKKIPKHIFFIAGSSFLFIMLLAIILLDILPSKCSLMSSDTEKSKCFVRYAGQIRSNPTTNHCAKIPLKEYQKQCYFKLALRNNDLALCEKAESDKCEQMVKKNIAVDSNDANLCNEITDTYERDNCYFIIAKSNHNPDDCLNITVLNERQRCYDNLNFNPNLNQIILQK